MEKLLHYLDLFKVDFSKVPKGANKAGVIVDSRCHPMMELVLKNFVYMLPDWPLFIFHVEGNRQFIENILGPNHSVTMIDLGVETFDRDRYSDLLKTEGFYHHIPADTILVFQCDSFIRRRDIDRFLSYKYVGAPWMESRNLMSYKIRIGNGGLSLRNKEAMLQIIRHPSMEEFKDQPEDGFFGLGVLFLYPDHVCPIEVASAFSVESVYYPDPFGMHRAWESMNDEQWEELCTLHLDD